MEKKALGVVSLLEIESDQNSNLLWKRVENLFKPFGVRLATNPHFSWQVAEDYDQDALLKELRNITSLIPSFIVHVSGLGIFAGIQPVLYLTIVRNQRLNQIHHLIWEKCTSYAIKVNPYYEAERWIPHITAAFDSSLSLHLSDLIEEVSFQVWDYELKINNISIAYQIGKNSGVFVSLPLADEAG